MNVLIVDDELLLLRSLRRTLVRAGHHVTLATNGRDALEALAHADFDVVLSDVRMPEMDGVELARRLARLHPTLPILFMSGHADTADRELLELAPLAVLPKPLDELRLLRLLASLGGTQEAVATH
ncbi:MAG: response regulator [Archangium sp.]|nr:response regulator [Archangium sp.]